MINGNESNKGFQAVRVTLDARPDMTGSLLKRFFTDIEPEYLGETYPIDFGSWKNIHRRWSRWAKNGVWKRIFTFLAGEADNEYGMINSTIVRAHQHSVGAINLPRDLAYFRSEKTQNSGYNG